MPNIIINVTDKRALLEGSPVIICGNSDYTVTFTFDDEWSLTGVRTARFVYVKDGKVQHEDKPFQGDTVDVPVLSDVAFVKVGVYAGELCTTTPARINCEASILCGSGTVTAPEPDVYSQIMALFEDMAQQGAFGATEAQAQQIEQNRRDIEKVEAIAKGRNQARVFKTPADMEDWLKDANNQGVAKVGDNLYIEALEVPDWWVAKVLTAPNASGYYYEVAQLEVQKVDLTNIEADIESLEDRATNLEEEVAEVKAKRDTAVTTDRELSSFGGGLRVLEIAGVSEQGENPTPDNQQSIKHPGDGGSLEVRTHTKNLYSGGDQTFTRRIEVQLERPLPPGTYTVSAFVESTDTDSTLSALGFVGGATNGAQRYVHLTRGERVSKTQTLYNPVSAIWLLASDSYDNGVGDTATWTDIQIEKGEKATPYEPYQSNSITIPLSEPLRQYDRIVEQDGVWGVERGTKAVPFGGTWSKRTESELPIESNLFSSADFITDNIKGVSIYMACTHMEFGGTVTGIAEAAELAQNGYFYKYGVSATSGTGTSTYICLNVSTADELNDALAGAVFEYQLATPVFEPFDTKVQKTLNSLKTYEGMTLIATDSEVEPVIEVEHGITQAGAMALENSCGLEVLRCEFEQMRAGLGDQVRFTSDGTTLTIESV